MLLGLCCLVTVALTNSGMISASAPSDHVALGIDSNTDGMTVINNSNGTIKATGGTGTINSNLANTAAVDFTHGGNNPHTGNNTVTNNGTIIGNIIFGDGAGNVLNVCGAQVLSASGIYVGTSCGAYVQNGSHVATVEFVGTSPLTQQVTGSISDVLSNQLNNTEDRYKNGHSHYYWVEGFGSYQQRPAIKGAAQSDSTVGGILVGIDKRYNEKVIIGAYAGGLKGRMKILDDTNKIINSNGVVIGAYGSLDLPKNSFLDVNVPVAYVTNKSNRTVKYNLAPNGIEYNKGSFNEYYVAPSVTLGQNLDYDNFTLVPSITASYIGQYIKGYTETGGFSCSGYQK